MQEKGSFNSLQVGQVPVTIFYFVVIVIQVSIPYRQARYFYQTPILYTLSCFNSLQVGQVLNSWTCFAISSACFNSLQVGQVLQYITEGFKSRFCFNSLQVGQVLSASLNYGGTQAKFQFLIGRLGTQYQGLPPQQKVNVSIPYRQARYLPPQLSVQTDSMCFNSLQVGQVQTTGVPNIGLEQRFNSLQVGQVLPLYDLHFGIADLFQFLIGRLGTLHHERIKDEFGSFNSLQVGQVHSSLGRCQAILLVSIPYRQARY